MNCLNRSPETFSDTVEADGNKSDVGKRLTELETAPPEEEDGETEPGACTCMILCRTANSKGSLLFCPLYSEMKI